MTQTWLKQTAEMRTWRADKMLKLRFICVELHEYGPIVVIASEVRQRTAVLVGC